MVQNPPANGGDSVWISGLGRSPGKGNDYPLQYYCLENPLDRGAWHAAVHGVAESDTPEQLTAHERCCINADPTVLTLLLTLSPLKMKCAFK